MNDDVASMRSKDNIIAALLEPLFAEFSDEA